MQYRFPDVSKEEWLAKVRRDLREKPLSELDFTVVGERFSPFHHREDLEGLPSPIRIAPGWKIGVFIVEQDIAAANASALKALAGGAESLWFSFYRPKTAGQKEQLLAGIYTDIVDITIDEEETMGARSSLAYDLNEAVNYRQSEPTFYLSVADHDFFATLAQHRAIRLCWQLAAGELGISQHCRLVTFVRKREGEDTYQNMIGSTVAALAAVCGGTDTLYLPVIGEDSPDFVNRISRNVQHILREESFLGTVADPAAGSYYLEALTDTYAQKIWQQFQQLQAQ